MAVQETLALVSLKLGVSDLPPSVSTLIMDKAEGHPFFSEELAYALRDAGILLIENGKRLEGGLWQKGNLLNLSA